MKDAVSRSWVVLTTFTTPEGHTGTVTHGPFEERESNIFMAGFALVLKERDATDVRSERTDVVDAGQGYMYALADEAIREVNGDVEREELLLDPARTPVD